MNRGRRTRTLIDILLRSRFPLTLAPESDICDIPGSGGWETTGDNPNLRLGGEPRCGWVRIDLRADVPAGTVIDLRVDRGQGLAKADAYSMGVADGKRTAFWCFVPLSPASDGLYLSFPGLKGRVTIRGISLRRVTELALVVDFWRQRFVAPDFRWFEVGTATARAFLLVRRSGIRGFYQFLTSGRFMNMGPDFYIHWRVTHRLDEQALDEQRVQAAGFAHKPLISVLMPVYNTDERWLRAGIESVLCQSYPHWELCVADDASTKAHVKRVLLEYAARDPRLRIVWRSENGHIVAASNSALALARGEFIATLDHDDTLDPNALFEVAALINEHPEADMIYSDEDHLTEAGLPSAPYFKPDWSPDLFLSQMYTAHLAVYRRALIESLGGYRPGFDGSQDYDLVLRLTEKTSRIFHIPKILYSWRAAAGSTALSAGNKVYAYDAAHRALSEAIARRGKHGSVEHVRGFPGHYYVRWAMARQERVSIIIPTRDRADLLDRCVGSIFQRSSYQDTEVVVIDNQSREPATFALFDSWKRREPERFRIVEANIPFNYAALNNLGAREARGGLLLFLNNDVEVVTRGWLEEMAGQAQREEIAAVGAMLLYPNRTIQHAGVMMGIGVWAGHAFKGCPHRFPGYAGRLLGPSNFLAVTGACLMMRRAVFDRLGGFDENLAVACNDVEFCIRAYRAGLYNVLLPGVVLLHHESATRGYEESREQRERFAREVGYVREKWPEFFDRDPFYNPNLTRAGEDFSIAVQ